MQTLACLKASASSTLWGWNSPEEMHLQRRECMQQIQGPLMRNWAIFFRLWQPKELMVYKGKKLKHTHTACY